MSEWSVIRSCCCLAPHFTKGELRHREVEFLPESRCALGLQGPSSGGEAGPVPRVSQPVSSLPCFPFLESGGACLLPACPCAHAPSKGGRALPSQACPCICVLYPVPSGLPEDLLPASLLPPRSVPAACEHWQGCGEQVLGSACYMRCSVSFPWLYSCHLLCSSW